MILMSLLDTLVRLAYGPDGGGAGFWMPEKASTVAGEVDWLFNFILWISTIFFVLIVAVMLIFIIKYRRREDRQSPEASPAHNTWLEIVWTGIPVILVGFIFYFGFKSYLDMSTSPSNAYEIHVAGQKWKWSFTYPNGYLDENLHVPVNRPVRLIMSSPDVIHSMYIPAFRVKADVVPGRYSYVWFQATETGEFDIFCAEYCGTSHSDMLAKVVVHPPGEFETWLDKASNILATMSPVDAGRKLYQVHGCQQCHSTDGSPRTGPTFFKLFGRPEKLTDGSEVTVDENYIRESILEPMAKVTEGFEPVMPTYQGRLKDPEIGAIIEYIKSLDDTPPATADETATEE